MNNPIAPRRSRPKFLPELVVAGLIFAGGAYFWSQNLAPQTPLAPKMVAAARATDTSEPNWKDAPDAEKKAAEAIIVAQLEAFKADDWDKAVTYQAADLRQNFASVEDFKRMIKTNYPQFANYESVKWGKARIDGSMLQIQVSITGKDGVQIAALYSMNKEPVDPKDRKKTDYRVSGVTGGQAQKAPDSKIV